MFKLAMIVLALGVPWQGATAQGTLEGDQKLACEAILCLSTSKRPHECAPAIRRYFSINAKKLSIRKTKRANFLKLCPKQSDDDVQRIVDRNNADALLPEDDSGKPPTPAQIQAAIARVMRALPVANAAAVQASRDYANCATRMGDANDCQSELDALNAAREGERVLWAELTALQKLLAATP